MPHERWPDLTFDELRPTADYVHRLLQVAGKYTLGLPFEPNWANVPLDVTPRGFATPTLHLDGETFIVDHDLIGAEVRIVADHGAETIPLADGSVAGYLEAFVAATDRLGLPRLSNLSQPEIAGAPPLDADHERRPFDRGVAARIAAGFARAHEALSRYQAPFKGARPRTGLMWGGFDVAATRYNGRPSTPPDTHPVFLRNGMTGEVVAVGFTLGDERSPMPAFYAYVSPPDGIAGADLGVEGAVWVEQVGLHVLPYEAVRAAADPIAAVVRFADAVYALAEEAGDWPPELLGRRHDGWYATSHLVF